MTDSEIIKAEYFDEDFLGNKINIGDEVIFEAPKYRDFVVGKVITKAAKTCQIEYVNDWNYPTKGRTEVVRQYYCQIIKHPNDLINRQKAEIEKHKKRCSCCGEKTTKTIINLQELLAEQKAEIERCVDTLCKKEDMVQLIAEERQQYYDELQIAKAEIENLKERLSHAVGIDNTKQNGCFPFD